VPVLKRAESAWHMPAISHSDFQGRGADVETLPGLGYHNFDHTWPNSERIGRGESFVRDWSIVALLPNSISEASLRLPENNKER